MCAYGDGPEMWSQRIRRARKANHCNECNLAIRPGDKYVYVFGKFEGDVFTLRFHQECEKLAELLGEIHCGGEYAVGQLFEHLEESGISVEAGESGSMTSFVREDRVSGAPGAARMGATVEDILRDWESIVSKYGHVAEVSGGEA